MSNNEYYINNLESQCDSLEAERDALEELILEIENLVRPESGAYPSNKIYKLINKHKEVTK